MDIRKPSVAGTFYQANALKLRDDIKYYLGFSKNIHNFEHVYGIVSPHAGYMYSAKTAGYGFNLLEGRKYKTVVIISPSHREYFPGISIFDGDGYETPLGIVHVDAELREELIKDSKKVVKGKQGHRQEHALEVQIPFLQYMLSGFKILPIVMGDQSKMYIDALAEKLASIISDDVLFVASSDLSHYHNKVEANRLDVKIEERINSFDFNGLQEDLSRNYCEACGGGGIVSLMKALSTKQIDKALVLNRTDSSEVTRDPSEVVGYLSAAFYK